MGGDRGVDLIGSLGGLTHRRVVVQGGPLVAVVGNVYPARSVRNSRSGPADLI